MSLLDEFEAARPRLLSVAHRILGSVHDAEDAVQTTWLRAQAAPERIDNPVAWLTTVTTRVCLDQLRTRRHRGELPLLTTAIPDDRLTADEDFIRREDVSRALLVLLDQLSPMQRAAYVLHDLFGVPFEGVAAALGTTTVNAKKLASRARNRVRGHEAVPAESPRDRQHREVVAAFLDAARGGDLAQMMALLAPDCVRVADAALLPPGTAASVRGAAAVAAETSRFAARIRASVTMLVNGWPADVIAPGGHPLAVIQVRTQGAHVTRIEIREVRTTGALDALPAAARSGPD